MNQLNLLTLHFTTKDKTYGLSLLEWETEWDARALFSVGFNGFGWWVDLFWVRILDPWGCQ